jgi:hypothetical protein
VSPSANGQRGFAVLAIQKHCCAIGSRPLRLLQSEGRIGQVHDRRVDRLDGLAVGGQMRQGTVMGKGYVDQAGSEVLVTKAGIGTLSAGDVPLRLKDSKPLPASD